MMQTDITAHVTTGAAIVYAIEWLKRAPGFTWLDANTKTLNRLVSALLAAVAALGIDWTFNSSEGTLVVTGLLWQSMALAGWEFCKQFVLQQLIFDGIIGPDAQRKALIADSTNIGA